MAMTKMRKKSLSSVRPTICQSSRSWRNGRVTSFSFKRSRICWLVPSNALRERCMEANCLLDALSIIGISPPLRVKFSPPFTVGFGSPPPGLVGEMSWSRSCLGIATMPSFVIMVEARLAVSPPCECVLEILCR